MGIGTIKGSGGCTVSVFGSGTLTGSGTGTVCGGGAAEGPSPGITGIGTIKW
jgi:hypothetical protein